MSESTILVVEDNPITRKMVRIALESGGYAVVEAGDGGGALAVARRRRPDLIVLDYVLPDTDGIQLLAALRAELGPPGVPALLVTGMVSRLDELRAKAGELTEVLGKPIEPSRLLEVVRAHLSAASSWGDGRTVLVVDDEPLNLKIAMLCLGRQGFSVSTATSGGEALGRARNEAPAAILAHVGMPSMDGFTLCREVRNDPRLAAIPIVLVSFSETEAADREMAHRLGADALVTSAPDLQAASEALRRVLSDATRAQPPPPLDEVEMAALYLQCVKAQLERQTAQTRALMRQAGIQATALALMRSLTETLGQPANVPEVIGDILVQCLDAAGLSTGLLYLIEDAGRFRLQALGVMSRVRHDAERSFGHADLLRSIVAGGRPEALAGEKGGVAADFLSRLGRTSALIVPFVVMGEGYGVLVLASDQQDLSESSWVGFGGSLAVQFAQTVALGQSLNRLAASEERYRALMEQANDAIVTLDLDYRILGMNRAGLRLFGAERHEIVGRSYEDFVAPEEREDLRGNRDVLAREDRVRVPLRHLMRADGTRVPVEMSVSVVRVGDDSTILSIFHDISERQRLENQIRQAQRMESVGRLAGGVAHDFNNLLTLILGYGNLLLDALDDRPDLRCQVEAILHAGDSAASLTRQLLAFSRRQVLVPTILDLNSLILQIEPMLRRMVGRDIELTVDLEPRLGNIRADHGQIEQVLMNLVLNARDATPRGGSIALATHHRPAAAGDPSYVVLTVSDTGSGIDDSVLPHIFEPFFTTKEEGKGTGLGLATVHGIVHQSGGHIEVASRPETGTTFSVRLPVIGEALPAAGAELAAPGRGDETVLVVEDEDVLRSLVSEILGAQGYFVLAADSAEEAQRLADRHDGRIHLLLTDTTVGPGGGLDLIAALVERRPDMRVTLMSGRSDRSLHTGMPGVDFLQKPFDPAFLARHVRAVLDRG